MTDDPHAFANGSTKALSSFQKIRDIGTVLCILLAVGWVVTPSSPPFEDKQVYLGKVDAIRFFGYKFFMMTQLDTQGPDPTAHASEPAASSVYRSLVLVGESQFRKDQELILILHRMGAEVCNLDRTHCEEVRGHSK